MLPQAGINHQFGAQISSAGSDPTGQQSRPLFNIGGLPVYVGAPVEPPYDSAENRNLAADPIWGAD
jgi:hypothetical protein